MSELDEDLELHENGKDVPLRLVVPTVWPITQAAWLEYERSKVRHLIATQTAVVQFRTDSDMARKAFGQSLQGLHDKHIETKTTVSAQTESIKALTVALTDVSNAVGAVRESTSETAEQLGRLAADLYGHSEDTREKFDSVNTEDKSQDARILSANMAAARAQIDAERATISADRAKIVAERATMDAVSARQEAALAKARSEKSDLVSMEAKKMSSWRAVSLLAAGPALYAIFHIIYEVVVSAPK